jgi:hypothetical protein
MVIICQLRLFENVISQTFFVVKSFCKKKYFPKKLHKKKIASRNTALEHLNFVRTFLKSSHNLKNIFIF